MKKKIIILAVVVFSILNLSILIENNVGNNVGLEYFIIAKATVNGGELPEATITCDAPRYGKCNALFAFDPDANAPFGLRTQPVWYYCNFTGDPKHKCTFWQETIIQGLSCFFLMLSLL